MANRRDEDQKMFREESWLNRVLGGGTQEQSANLTPSDLMGGISTPRQYSSSGFDPSATQKRDIGIVGGSGQDGLMNPQAAAFADQAETPRRYAPESPEAVRASGIEKLQFGNESIYKGPGGKDYGGAIYSDSPIGATQQGFDRDIKKYGQTIPAMDKSVMEKYNKPPQQGLTLQRNSGAARYFSQAQELMGSLPYGSPGDRQKRQSMLQQAQQLVGIGRGMNQQQTSSNRNAIDLAQYNRGIAADERGVVESDRKHELDIANAGRQADPFKRYEQVDPTVIKDEYGNESVASKGGIFDPVTGRFVNPATGEPIEQRGIVPAPVSPEPQTGIAGAKAAALKQANQNLSTMSNEEIGAMVDKGDLAVKTAEKELERRGVLRKQ